MKSPEVFEVPSEGAYAILDMKGKHIGIAFGKAMAREIIGSMNDHLTSEATQSGTIYRAEEIQIIGVKK